MRRKLLLTVYILILTLVATMLLTCCSIDIRDKNASSVSLTNNKATSYLIALSPSPLITVGPTPSGIKGVLSDDYKEAFEYFKETALRSEFGSQSVNDIVRRWEKDICIYIKGSATQTDLYDIDENIKLLNEIQGVPDIYFTDNEEDANYTISFISQSDMNNITKEYGETAWGFTTVWWDDSYSITRAAVNIVCDLQTQEQRDHAILEEMTQSLGILNDSDMYEGSIFKAFHSDYPNKLADIDVKVIEILYNTNISSGMTLEEITFILFGG